MLKTIPGKDMFKNLGSYTLEHLPQSVIRLWQCYRTPHEAFLGRGIRGLKTFH